MSTATLYTPTGAEPWILGIDFGTTFTCAAVREGDQVRELHIDGSTRMPSAVLLDGESIIVGRAAESRAPLAPECFERTPKRYMQTCDEGILLGATYVPIARLVGAVLRSVWEEALAQHGGRHPEETRLTHPAAWQSDRRQLLLDAAAEAGIPEPVLLPEPEAAAICLARDDVTAALGQGSLSCVLDLGGGTFDVSVLRRTGNRFRVVGQSLGLDRTGGETFDDLLHHELGSSLEPETWEQLQHGDGEWLWANLELRRRVREAKEAVSKEPTHPIVVPAPVSKELQVTRDGFERLIERDIQEVLEVAERALEQAGVSPSQLSAVYLVGGSSRIPLVRRRVAERFGRADREKDPKSVVAQGAVAFSSALLGERPVVRNDATPKRPWWQLCAAVTGVALVAMALFFLLGGGQKRLSGQILDHKGEPLANLPIHVTAVGGKTKNWNVKTDSDGHFEVHGDAEKLDPTSIYVSATFKYAGEKWEYMLEQVEKSGNFNYSKLDFKVGLSGEHGGVLTPLDIPFEVEDPASVTAQGGEGAVLALYLEPVTGKLLDGTKAKARRYEMPLDDLKAIEGIPIAWYRVRGEVLRPDGTGFGVLFDDDERGLVPEYELSFESISPEPEAQSVSLSPDPAILAEVGAPAGGVLP